MCTFVERTFNNLLTNLTLNTMAIVENFWLKGQKKKLGGSVIYQAMGQTRQRALATEVRNPRTQSQMNQRVKWANLVNLYRANQSWMKYAFETKKATQSDYNKFMSLNVTNSNIFLTKNIAAAGGCVIQSYLFTQGSLPSIEVNYSSGNNYWDTNIFLGAGYEFLNTSVASFTRTVLDNNPAIQEGDQLSFIRMTQLTNSDNGAPYVIVRKYEVVLSLTNQANLWDFLPHEYIDSTEDADMARLIVLDSNQAGGFLLILSRTTGGRTLVSTQRLIVANNNALISAYSSENALQTAISSYGDSDEPFLTSTTANTSGNVYVPNSIIDVKVGTESHVPGSRFYLQTTDAAKTLEVICSSSLGFTPVRIDITYWLNYDVDVEKNKDEQYLLALVNKTRELGAVGINMNFNACTRELVEVFHREGLLVSIWTVNEMSDMIKVINLGVDNITSRNPLQLKVIVDMSEK